MESSSPRESSPGGAPPQPEALARIMLRPPAGSLPLGFFAFGTGNVLPAATQSRRVPEPQVRQHAAAAQRTVLPLGRRGRARTSLQGDLGHQLDQAEREAGVRRQL
ncbi:hypothetical protein [Streptomyces collinus]|uniref:hypothetical protein n=1 Tax=Streptomyces collinus TaxID=42684 RepID=UPI0033C9FC2C